MYQDILMQCFQALDKQRSYRAVYYILVGKRSIQTIQDAYLFQLTVYFRLLPKLTLDRFDQSVKKMVETGSIRLNEEGRVDVLYVNACEDKRRQLIKQINGMAYADVHDTFFKRLNLTIQTFTHLSVDDRQFQVIEEDLIVQRFVKRFYKENKSALPSFLNEIYKWLNIQLTEINPRYAEIFVDRMTGYNQTGLSIQQLSIKYGEDVEDVQLILLAIEHMLLNDVVNNEAHFLFSMLEKQSVGKDHFMTNSAKKTWHYYKQGHSIDEMMAIRHLKRGTIEDHLIEIAYLDAEFPYERYINKKEESILLETINNENVRKLSVIMNALPSSINYFKLRLMIAKEINEVLIHGIK